MKFQLILIPCCVLSMLKIIQLNLQCSAHFLLLRFRLTLCYFVTTFKFLNQNFFWTISVEITLMFSSCLCHEKETAQYTQEGIGRIRERERERKRLQNGPKIYVAPWSIRKGCKCRKNGELYTWSDDKCMVQLTLLNTTVEASPVSNQLQ